MGMLSFKWGKKKDTAPKYFKVMFFQDYVKKANEQITENLGKWNCFDIDFPTKFLDHLYWLIKERNLDYRDPGWGDFRGKTTIVIGTKDADFKDHERRR